MFLENFGYEVYGVTKNFPCALFEGNTTIVASIGVIYFMPKSVIVEPIKTMFFFCN
jgi:hypothetical protein